MFVFLFIDFTVAFLFHNLHNAAHRVRFVMFCLQMCCFFSHTRRATASIVVIILYVNIIICCVHEIIAKREEKRVLKICLKTIIWCDLYKWHFFSFLPFFLFSEKMKNGSVIKRPNQRVIFHVHNLSALCVQSVVCKFKHYVPCLRFTRSDRCVGCAIQLKMSRRKKWKKESVAFLNL